MIGPATLPEPVGARFDILVPCYNYGRFLAAAVESVLTQADAEVRVLVIDDCSQDNTSAIGRALAARDSRVTFRRHETNRGHIATYNEGIEWASGAFFGILSADDLLMPGALAAAGAAFHADADIELVYGRMINFYDGLPVEAILAGTIPVRAAPEIRVEWLADGKGPGVSAQAVDAAADDGVDIMDTVQFFRRNRRANGVPASGTFTRCGTQKLVGGYRATLPHSGDYEMWLRVASRGRAAFLKRFQVATRRHDANMSRQYGCVRDATERAKALNELEAFAGECLPAGLMTEMRRALAHEALSLTTIPLVEGSRAERHALADLARTLDPKITRRPAWAVYLVKLAMGPRAWTALRRLVPHGA